MTRIVTFLGAGPELQNRLGMAVAQWFAQRQRRVLLVVPSPAISLSTLYGVELQPQPQNYAPNLDIAELQTTDSLSQVWDNLTDVVEPYLPSDLIGKVYAGELMILPGMDTLLTLNAMRLHYTRDRYDVIIYAGANSRDTLRLLGLPNAIAWYYRRFRRVLEHLDLSKLATAIGGPIASAIMAANIDTQKINTSIAQAKDWVDRGVAVAADAQQLTVLLVTTQQTGAIAETSWLWGSAQQVNLPISQLLYCPEANQPTPGTSDDIAATFSPLQLTTLSPEICQNDADLVQALPDMDHLPVAPPPHSIDLESQQVRVFLPGFNKQQVKLSEYSGELTIEAGDQRRHIELPAALKGKPVTSGKFEAPYLIVSFA
ncbi:ArsA family ATPase [Candidatus Synechococcus calcipolaris G9]|uniref:ArsA family ATPase n=1 Tax=Candidatus Synechococcus calcipolaris G9 TaxID=1497997 RepID=A0ABT6F334_9SYNE|nr:ArsA family ATPase [Candidatus Synechococcus calcipolaris]MDG2992283.1 ArsA family ATPase [Candidatus Synechococcus calcipolaris G9]